jgi:hypothetical protein
MKLSGIISDDDYYTASEEIRANARLLLSKLVNFEALAVNCYEKSVDDGGFIITSGFRSMLKHVKIYEEKNAIRKKQGLDPLPIPMFSKHLKALAVDIYDPKKRLQKWCLGNEKILKQLGLYFERFETTPDWVHCQCVAPKSGNTFYWPYLKPTEGIHV